MALAQPLESPRAREDEPSVIRPSPTAAGETLARDAEAGGGPFKEPPEYEGSIGRTTFDDRGSADGTITVVLPPENGPSVTVATYSRLSGMLRIFSKLWDGTTSTFSGGKTTDRKSVV